MRRLGQLLLFYLMLLWLGSMLLAGNSACLPLIGLPHAWRERALQHLISRTFRLFLAGCERCGLMELDLTALDALNAYPGPGGLVLAANHPSMIDVFLVVSRLDRAVCLMKSSLMGNVLLAPGAFLAGYIPNQGAEALVRRAAKAVRRGHTLLIFPEGTRTVSPPINELKAGAALIAKVARAPLQLVVIETNSPYLAKGWPIWRPPVFPLRYHARLSAQLDASPPVADTIQAMHARFTHELPAGPFHLS